MSFIFYERKWKGEACKGSEVSLRNGSALEVTMVWMGAFPD